MQTEKAPAIEGRYLLKERIAIHGDVELYAAQDEQLGRAVTVQLLSGAAGAGAARAFLRHQQLASSIQNCPVFTVYDAGRWHSRPYSVMEREKGVAPEALHRPGYPPGLAGVLRASRQIAEAVACCREAGLTDWTFTPDAVRVDAEGNGCLAVYEGLGGSNGSSHPGKDAAALHALMLLMLTGRPDAGGAALRAALVPETLIRFVEGLDPTRNPQIRTARDVASSVAAFEEASVKPTQAYTPLPADGVPSSALKSPAIAPLPPVNPAEAPTVAAQVHPEPEPLPMASQSPPAPYTPPMGVERKEHASRRRPALLLLGGVLLAALLFFIAAQLVLRPYMTAQGAAASGSAPLQVPVPDLLGHDIEEARGVAGSSNLNLAVGEPFHDPNVALDRVAGQEPAPGTQLQAGSLITVSLSLGPEAQPPPAEPPPAVEPQPQPEQPGEGNKKGGKKERDKDNDD